jgi:hypothetical protein
MIPSRSTRILDAEIAVDEPHVDVAGGGRLGDGHRPLGCGGVEPPRDQELAQIPSAPEMLGDGDDDVDLPELSKLVSCEPVAVVGQDRLECPAALDQRDGGDLVASGEHRHRADRRLPPDEDDVRAPLGDQARQDRLDPGVLRLAIGGVAGSLPERGRSQAHREPRDRHAGALSVEARDVGAARGQGAEAMAAGRQPGHDLAAQHPAPAPVRRVQRAHVEDVDRWPSACTGVLVRAGPRPAHLSRGPWRPITALA